MFGATCCTAPNHLFEFVSEHQAKQAVLAFAGQASGAPDHDVQPVIEFGFQIELRVLLSDIGVKRWPQRVLSPSPP